MPTPFTMPIPKIGNHPVGCPCDTCTNARKRLAKSPYVQQLQSLVLQFHGEWQRVHGEWQQAMVAGLSITQDLHAEGKESAWANENLDDMAAASARKAVLLETMTAERDALKTERDGYATELRVITEEANKQRKAADEATAALKLAKKWGDDLQAENARLMTALKQADKDIEQERRAGWTETRVVGVVAVVLSGLAFFLIGRFGR